MSQDLLQPSTKPPVSPTKKHSDSSPISFALQEQRRPRISAKPKHRSVSCLLVETNSVYKRTLSDGTKHINQYSIQRELGRGYHCTSFINTFISTANDCVLLLTTATVVSKSEIGSR